MRLVARVRRGFDEEGIMCGPFEGTAEAELFHERLMTGPSTVLVEYKELREPDKVLEEIELLEAIERTRREVR